MWARFPRDATPLGLRGRAPDSVELSRTTSWLTDGGKLQGVVVRLGYGDVRVSLAHDEAGRYAVGFGTDEYPVPPEGFMGLTGNAADGWQGVLRGGAFGVMISAPQKESVIAAARTLAPLP
jgi:hypothetical protein